MNENAEKQVWDLLASAQEGALATLDGEKPFVSSVGFIYERSTTESRLGQVYFLLSDLARHTRQLNVNPVGSLLVHAKDASLSVHERPRLTMTGKVSRVEDPKKFEDLKEKYLRIFPRSQIFFTLKDFRFYVLIPEEIYWVGGFGKVLTLP